MGDLIALSSKEDVSEMIPSFCFYYKEILYCQNISISIEANNGIYYISLLFPVLQRIGQVLGKNIGPFVKHFIVPLQIYMCDTVGSVERVAKEVFQVYFIVVTHTVNYS